MASTSIPEANVLLGPILLGNFFNWGLYGILGLQTYLYLIWFPNDRPFTKFLVITLFALDSLQTAVCAYDVWFLTVSGWGNIGVLTTTPWSLCIAVILGGLVSATVQLFFAHRVWMLSKSTVITLVIIAISIAQCVSAITAAIQIWITKPDNSKFLPTFDALSLWLAGSLACDIVIAISMVYCLLKLKPKSSLKAADALIARFINYAVQSGTFTAVCAGVDLTLFLKFRSNNLHDTAFFMLGKLYSNTLLANLNARRSLDIRRDVESASTGTVLTDPQALSLPFWPELSARGIGSRDLSVQSGTTREQGSLAGETDLSTSNLNPNKNQHPTSRFHSLHPP